MAYCITIHKSQGSTFDFSYSIHEWEKLDETLKYVSLVVFVVVFFSNITAYNNIIIIIIFDIICI